MFACLGLATTSYSDNPRRATATYAHDDCPPPLRFSSSHDWNRALNRAMDHSHVVWHALPMKRKQSFAKNYPAGGTQTQNPTPTEADCIIPPTCWHTRKTCVGHCGQTGAPGRVRVRLQQALSTPESPRPPALGRLGAASRRPRSRPLGPFPLPRRGALSPAPEPHDTQAVRLPLSS